MNRSCDRRFGLESALEFIELEETLREFSGSNQFIYIANPGNWGDGLIRYATESFFRRKGFSFKPLRFSRAIDIGRNELEEMVGSSAPRAVYGGGGAFFPKYRMHKVMPSLLSKFESMLVLPNSFSVPASKLGFREHDIIFRRDRENSTAFAPQSQFCHDMALSLPMIIAPDPTQGPGYFFREDKEKKHSGRLPSSNRDISSEGNEFTEVHGFLKAIAQFSEVHTDRLHVSIAASLMGRQVKMYPNSYFKNLSIYESSMRVAFPNVSFQESHP